MVYVCNRWASCLVRRPSVRSTTCRGIPDVPTSHQYVVLSLAIGTYPYLSFLSRRDRKTAATRTTLARPRKLSPPVIPYNANLGHVFCKEINSFFLLRVKIPKDDRTVHLADGTSPKTRSKRSVSRLEFGKRRIVAGNNNSIGNGSDDCFVGPPSHRQGLIGKFQYPD